jgi:hypothetical protein
LAMNGSVPKIWDPMWAWIPTTSTWSSSRDPRSAWSARPEREREAELRVVVAGAHVLVGVCVDAGGDAQPHLRDRPAPAARRSRRSSSSKESTTMRPTPTSNARSSSASDLLLPWWISDRAGSPATNAVCSSPSEATSISSPPRRRSAGSRWCTRPWRRRSRRHRGSPRGNGDTAPAGRPRPRPTAVCRVRVARSVTRHAADGQHAVVVSLSGQGPGSGHRHIRLRRRPAAA